MTFSVWCPECDDEWTKQRKSQAIYSAQRHNQAFGHQAAVEGFE